MHRDNQVFLLLWLGQALQGLSTLSRILSVSLGQLA
jgi:hypothetical protein